MQDIVVQKYGGSSVADIPKLERVADRVAATAKQGKKTCVVVSAMGRTTDDLIRLALDTVNGGPRGTDPRRRIRVVQGDITTLRVDALVNPTDPNFSGDGGVDRAVHRAGGPAIRAACDTLRATTLPHGLSVGAAVATTAGNLPATWIVHTVGPRYSHSEDRTAQLRAAYTRSLAAAEAVGAVPRGLEPLDDLPVLLPAEGL